VKFSIKGEGKGNRIPLWISLFLPILFVCAGALAEPGDEETNEMRLDPDYAAGRRAIEAKDWQNAIRLLSSAALRDTRNAEIQNYLGYAYRNTGELSAAFKHYSRALQINPRHRGAHEYLGEAYLMVNNVGKAEEHLAALKGICLLPCEETGILERKISEYRKNK
jgi:tetratricopeptide (TPR) repeat protein